MVHWQVREIKANFADIFLANKKTQHKGTNVETVPKLWKQN